MRLWYLLYYKLKNCTEVTITTNLKMLKCIFYEEGSYNKALKLYKQYSNPFKTLKCIFFV